MAKDFDTHGDARKYCERFGIKPVPMKVFDTAHALRRAYDAGKKDSCDNTNENS